MKPQARRVLAWGFAWNKTPGSHVVKCERRDEKMMVISEASRDQIKMHLRLKFMAWMTTLSDRQLIALNQEWDAQWDSIVNDTTPAVGTNPALTVLRQKLGTHELGANNRVNL